jgi:hypothetical protein
MGFADFDVLLARRPGVDHLFFFFYLTMHASTAMNVDRTTVSITSGPVSSAGMVSSPVDILAGLPATWSKIPIKIRIAGAPVSSIEHDNDTIGVDCRSGQGSKVKTHRP